LRLITGYTEIYFLEYFNSNIDCLYPLTWYEELLKIYVNYWELAEGSIVYLSSELVEDGSKDRYGSSQQFLQ
jgi:hypothetical protein